MWIDISRRRFVASLGAAAASLGAPTVLRAATGPTVNFGLLRTGFSVLFSSYMVEKRFDLKHGVNLQPTNSYTAVRSYYNDFVAGNFDFALGTWDTFVTRYLAGVPLKLLNNISTAAMVNIVALKGGAGSLEDLVGKTVAAPINSGTFRLTRFIAEDYHKVSFENQVKVQNVPSPATAVTLAMAGTVDAALSWEPNISEAIARDPKLEVIYNLGEDFQKQTNRPLPFFVSAVRADVLTKSNGIAARLAAAVNDCIAGMKANPGEVIKLAAPAMNVDPKGLKIAFESGRLGLSPMAMSDPKAQAVIENACQLLAKHGELKHAIDKGLFAI